MRQGESEAAGGEPTALLDRSHSQDSPDSERQLLHEMSEPAQHGGEGDVESYHSSGVGKQDVQETAN